MIEHDDIAYLELTEVADLVHTREITSVEVTEAVLARIAELDPTLQSYAFVSTVSAMAAAKKADDERARGRYRGPLHGVPVAVKDLCQPTDAPTASGTTIHAGYMSSYAATVVRAYAQPERC